MPERFRGASLGRKTRRSASMQVTRAQRTEDQI